MEEVTYEHRESTEVIKDSLYKITKLIKVQKKRVLTNPDIEARKKLKKFGKVAGTEKGFVEPTIQFDDKDIYLLPFGQEKNDEAISKFVSTRTHREKMDQLKRKEDELKSGKTDESRRRQVYLNEPQSFSIKVSNIPVDLTQAELEDFFSVGVRPRKIYRPVGKEDKKVRDFALIHYNTQSDAAAAITRFNEKRCGCQILNAEFADNRGPTNSKAGARPFFKK